MKKYIEPRINIHELSTGSVLLAGSTPEDYIGPLNSRSDDFMPIDFAANGFVFDGGGLTEEELLR